jgi:hypothetical protein
MYAPYGNNDVSFPLDLSIDRWTNDPGFCLYRNFIGDLFSRPHSNRRTLANVDPKYFVSNLAARVSSSAEIVIRC